MFIVNQRELICLCKQCTSLSSSPCGMPSHCSLILRALQELGLHGCGHLSVLPILCVRGSLTLGCIWGPLGPFPWQIGVSGALQKYYWHCCDSGCFVFMYVNKNGSSRGSSRIWSLCLGFKPTPFAGCWSVLDVNALPLAVVITYFLAPQLCGGCVGPPGLFWRKSWTGKVLLRGIPLECS